MSKPDFKLKVQTRGAKYGEYVGAAWKNKAGGINIKIQPGVGIIGQEGVDVTLWPNEERQGGGDFTPRGGGGRDDFGDDDLDGIPFATCTADDSARLISKVRV